MTGQGSGRRRINFARTVLIGVVGSTIPLIGNVVGSLVADWSGGVSWLAVPVTAVVFGVIGAFATAHIEERIPESGASPPSGMPARRKRRGMSLGVGLLVTVLVLAGGALAVALGARYAVGWLTGDEDGKPRLVQAKTTTNKNVALTVHQVLQTTHYTRVEVSVSNGLANEIRLNLFENCTLRALDRTTLQADPFRSDWSESVAPGARDQGGTIVFPGHVSDSATAAELSFASVWEAGFTGPKSLTVTGLALHAP